MVWIPIGHWMMRVLVGLDLGLCDRSFLVFLVGHNQSDFFIISFCPRIASQYLSSSVYVGVSPSSLPEVSSFCTGCAPWCSAFLHFFRLSVSPLGSCQREEVAW